MEVKIDLSLEWCGTSQSREYCELDSNGVVGGSNGIRLFRRDTVLLYSITSEWQDRCGQYNIITEIH